MEWHPNVNLLGRKLLQRDQSAVQASLAPGWRGDATRIKPDLTVMLDHITIGFIGVAAGTKVGDSFLIHEVIGGCAEHQHKPRPPLGFSEGNGVIVCSVPVWPSILNLAVRAGLTLEIHDRLSSLPAPSHWMLMDDVVDDTETAGGDP